ncbi:DNA-binding protein [Nonomuraea terrae]|uniref:DNA-binding protein n=1 Tax=Nonomuraea terrae TaxID=2530383 RepID=A0A4R4ZA10_9ACTN|nr:helix-turn-helix domain-containing protein [Nonomuraea terrae]TDD54570.1 DNA-binding protein [Nonomuraea terrae]
MTGDILDDPLFTAEEAAEEVGVKVATIYVWVHRGHLTPAGTRGKHKLFRLGDVFAAESTRDRKRRKRPVAC